MALSLRDIYCAERDEEVALLMDLIKAINLRDAGTAGTHAWHSYDGRELGLPSSKSYSLRVASSASTNFTSHSGNRPFVALSASTRSESLDFTRSLSDGGGGDDSAASGSGELDFQMDATIEKHNLRVSFKIPESD